MFFKHANRDPGGILEFNPALSEGFMFFVIEGLKSLGEQISDYQTVLLFWFGLHKPHLFVKGRLLEKLIPVEELRRVEKHEFLETSLLALAKIRAKSR